MLNLDQMSHFTLALESGFGHCSVAEHLVCVQKVAVWVGKTRLKPRWTAARLDSTGLNKPKGLPLNKAAFCVTKWFASKCSGESENYWPAPIVSARVPVLGILPDQTAANRNSESGPTGSLL